MPFHKILTKYLHVKITMSVLLFLLNQDFKKINSYWFVLFFICMFNVIFFRYNLTLKLYKRYYFCIIRDCPCTRLF